MTYGQLRESLRKQETAGYIEKSANPEGGLLLTPAPNVVDAFSASKWRVYLMRRDVRVCQQRLPHANFADALLLADLSYWRRDSKIKRNGYFLKTHAQLVTETGLSPDQIKRALLRLEEAELIQRVQRRGQKTCRRLLHIKVNAT
jgi:hypothetical protein